MGLPWAVHLAAETWIVAWVREDARASFQAGMEEGGTGAMAFIPVARWESTSLANL
jgi:hypothetical protein